MVTELCVCVCVCVCDQVMLTEPPMNPMKNREKMIEVRVMQLLHEAIFVQ